MKMLKETLFIPVALPASLVQGTQHGRATVYWVPTTVHGGQVEDAGAETIKFRILNCY